MFEPLPIEAMHLVISGFTQASDKPTGCQKLWMRLRGIANSPTALVDLRPWNENWRQYAEAIWLAAGQGTPRVYVYAFSFGGGWGFPQLARQLDARGIKIQHAVLCDPVYRHWYRLGAWRSLWPWSQIVVPANVREVSWFRQRNDLPMGHDLVAEQPKATHINAAWWVNGRRHRFMDDAPEWHKEACEVAQHAASILPVHRRKCNRPPAGWKCTREPNHDGPCAAIADEGPSGYVPRAQYGLEPSSGGIET